VNTLELNELFKYICALGLIVVVIVIWGWMLGLFVLFVELLIDAWITDLRNAMR